MTTQILTIEKNVPIPESAQGRYFGGKISPFRTLADQMAFNDSVTVDEKTARLLGGYLRAIDGVKPVQRKLENGMYRIWKTKRE